jgi:hypothetical protein
MVTLKPFCILDGSDAVTFHSAHIIYLFGMLVLKNGKRIYIQSNRIKTAYPSYYLTRMVPSSNCGGE